MAGLDIAEPSEAPPLVGLDFDDRVDRMVSWWLENFEDPAEATPYESREGGYQWVWGGPHEPDDLLHAYFPDASDEELQAATDEITSDGLFEWAPNQRRLFEVFDDGDAYEQEPPIEEQLDALRGELPSIKEQIADWREIVKGVGHNRPPDEFRIGPNDDELHAAETAVDAVETELARPDPLNHADPTVLERALKAFGTLRNKLGGWLAAGATMAAAAAFQGVFKEIGAQLAKDPAALIHRLEKASDIIANWLNLLTAPF